MKIHNNEVVRSNGQLGMIRCTVAQKLVIPSNTTVMIDDKLDRKIQAGTFLGMTQSCSHSTLPDSVSITPTLEDVDSSNQVFAELSNI